VGVKYANATTSGITALHPALGVGPGDEVITMPLIFAALAAAILHADAVPTFADIDRKTLHRLNPTTDTTKAVVVTHLAGYPAEMEAFKKLADRHGL
jgi:dTDP-4-amino-4,6-dideoxygalactose transaminase